MLRELGKERIIKIRYRSDDGNVLDASLLSDICCYITENRKSFTHVSKVCCHLTLFFAIKTVFIDVTSKRFLQLLDPMK